MKASLLRRMILAQGLVLLLASALLLTLIFGSLVWSRRGIWDEDLELTAAALLVLLQDETDPARLQLQAGRIQNILEAATEQTGLVKRGENKSLEQLFDREGRLLFRSTAAPEIPLTLGGPGFHDQELHGRRWRVFVKDDPASGLRVLTARPRALGQLIVWRSFRTVPLQISIGLVIVAVFTWLVSRRALRPLRQLAAAVEARDPGDLDPLEGHAELAETKPLITALNKLFHRVEALVETQRRFVADAAHELRTPLAVISAQAHVLQQAKDGVRREIAGQDLQQGVARAVQLVGQLLSVARLDAADALAMAPLDLAVLARERLGMLASQALAKGQILGFIGPDSLPWQGDALILTSAVDNLLVNAIRYTPEAGRINLRLEAGPHEVRLAVEDTGPGIPAAFREAAFERFSRLPGAQEAGSGLGLAIVRSAVELHGGRVTLADPATGSGLLATLHLPRAKPHPAGGASH